MHATCFLFPVSIRNVICELLDSAAGRSHRPLPGGSKATADGIA